MLDENNSNFLFSIPPYILMEEERHGKATAENRKRISGKWVRYLRVRFI